MDNTLDRQIKVKHLIKVIKDHNKLSYKWDGSIKEYIEWSIGKWNEDKVEDLITLEDIKITEEKMERLDDKKFKEHSKTMEEIVLSAIQDIKDSLSCIERLYKQDKTEKQEWDEHF